MGTEERIRLGLRPNLGQFSLLVVVNAFVGAMVGLERSVLPLVAEADFGLASRSAALSFLVSFGIVKALANLVAGRFSDRIGRKRILVLGWLVGLPVPLLIIAAPTWGWVVFANVLLGINQGLCWSTTVIMKIDLVGPRQRGLAMGINEFAGYVAVALAALLSGYLAADYGLRPAPFLPGIAFALAGLALSAFFVRETRGHARLEAQAHAQGPGDHLSFGQVLLLTSWRDRALFAVSQAGLANNLNDGMVWGLLPLYLFARGLPIAQVAVVSATYPGVWGVTQLFTGALSDRLGRKWLIAAGMWVQAVGILFFVVGGGYAAWLAGAVLLGLGTALVYPTLLAAISDVAHPSWRASAVGVYRLWRDRAAGETSPAAPSVASAATRPWEPRLDVRRRARPGEAFIEALLFLCGALSILTTLGLVVVLAREAWLFFGSVNLLDFLTTSVWQPHAGRFGVLPLVNATLMTSTIALLVSVPLGVAAAIYLSEYASARARGILKPILEVLAGVPTVVYGYFALTFMTPMLRALLGQDNVQIYNNASAGIVMGIMILPLISSMSEDALHAVPRSLREAAYGMGATRLETAVTVVVPAALSGIVAAFIVGMARAVGETMIVAIAAGAGPRLTFNPLEAAETMTGYIARISGGDLSYDSLDYNSIFSIGLLLFLITLGLNIVSRRVAARFREVYE